MAVVGAVIALRTHNVVRLISLAGAVVACPAFTTGLCQVVVTTIEACCAVDTLVLSIQASVAGEGADGTLLRLTGALRAVVPCWACVCIIALVRGG